MIPTGIARRQSELMKELNGWFTDPITTYTQYGIYDPDEFDLVPKKGHIEKQIKFKEEELGRLKQRRENEQRYYEEREKALSLEIAGLRQKLTG